ncbi:MAG: hypothetical protein WAT93_05660 [Pontixanthobacter sp.]
MNAILGLDAIDYDYVVRSGAWDNLLSPEEWAAMMAPIDVEALTPEETLALALEADETAAYWLAQDCVL